MFFYAFLILFRCDETSERFAPTSERFVPTSERFVSTSERFVQTSDRFGANLSEVRARPLRGFASRSELRLNIFLAASEFLM